MRKVAKFNLTISVMDVRMVTKFNHTIVVVDVRKVAHLILQSLLWTYVR